MRKYINILVEPAPHQQRQTSTEQIMRAVFLALLPIWGMSIYKYGLAAFSLGLLCMVCCLGLEHWLLSLQQQRPKQLFGDYSALITGLLFALTLPPSLPLWIAVMGSVICMTIGKHAFGGLGQNPFNPAILGRVFLQISFTIPMTSWVAPFQNNRFFRFYEGNLTLPFQQPAVDGISAATPLGRLKFEGVPTDWMNFILDLTPGSLGEVSPILLLFLAGILAFKKYLDWRIPVSIIGFTLLFTLLMQTLGSFPSPWFVLFSGGFMLGVLFMATDMVTSPITPLGVWAYGFLVAFLIFLIRFFGGLAEGVAFAILLGNAVTPLLHLVTQPRVFGTKRGRK